MVNTPDPKLSERVRMALAKANLDYKEAAPLVSEKLGKSVSRELLSRIGRVERGAELGLLEAIAAATGVSRDWLVGATRDMGEYLKTGQLPLPLADALDDLRATPTPSDDLIEAVPIAELLEAARARAGQVEEEGDQAA